MRASLNLNLGQHLTLTPQLQQAIRLLQLSTLELNQEIQQALDKNPLLELDEPEDRAPVTHEKQSNEEKAELESAPANDPSMDALWEEHYISSTSPRNNASDEAPNYEQIIGTHLSLQEHLLWQLSMCRLSEVDNAIAIAIIDAIDDDGLLRASLTEILESLGLDTSETPVELDEVEAVLQRIQRFDPLGCGARDLRESLLIQLEPFEADTPWLKQTKHILKHDFDALARKEFDSLRRRYKLKPEGLSAILELIKRLEPRPGAKIHPAKTDYIVPDVIVRKHQQHWRVELHQDTLPKIRLNTHYASLVKRADNSPTNNFLRDNLQEARWFIKSLQSRHDTLLRVSRKIVEHQQGFFEHGPEAMKPMILNDIAIALELHESTISRITTNKYMLTPKGIFELKYFFSSHVKTANGGECSSTAICAIIKKLIASEAANKPLSDNKIAQIIAAEGINVARRTVAKYREAMQIPPSHERKSLA